MALQELLNKVRAYMPSDKAEAVAEAYQFAAEAHRGQVRLSGEPFVGHPLQTAIILADLQLDAPTIIAALLHDVPEDCGVPLSKIEKQFGAEVGRLVDGVTKLAHFGWPPSLHLEGKAQENRVQAENLRKMLVAMAQDMRVVLIKLADRLHNLRTLQAQSEERRQAISQETLEIYAPLAERLGIWEIKWQMEDLAFRYLKPDEYRQTARLVSAKRASRERYITRVVELLRQELDAAGLRAEVSGRPKHLYSIYTKQRKYAQAGKDFDDIYDLAAIRVLVDSEADCYSALGVVHNLWHPIPGQFDDYIANPKDNGYRALHTSVICLDGKPIEIQARSREAHRIAEYGVAAHWLYKEGGKRDVQWEERFAWLRQLLEWQREVSGAEEFVESVKTDIFQDQVFVYTPKGEIKVLTAGATPLDFAYRVHTNLGHRCIGTKVNGRLVPLSYHLQNGDVVEIMATKVNRGPSRDWLNPNLGYVNTSHAREKIRQWFRHQQREENIEKGKEAVERELRRLGLEVAGEEVAKLFNYDRWEDFLAAVGVGEVTIAQIAQKLSGPEEAPEAFPKVKAPSVETPASVQVLGVGDLLTHLALCCHPAPGDDIMGYITRSKGITIHRRDCINIVNEDEPERLIVVSWGAEGHLYPVAVRIDAWDRVGLIRDISTVVSDERVNMATVSATSHSDHTMSIYLTLDISGIGQLSRILSRIEGVRGVISARRSLEALPQEVRDAS